MTSLESINLPMWHQLHTTWCEAMAAAKSAETQLDKQVKYALEQDGKADIKQDGVGVVDVELDMNEVMNCWLLASQSLAAMDEFVSEHLVKQALIKQIA